MPPGALLPVIVPPPGICTTAAPRPIIAIVPLSRYRKGLVALPAIRRAIASPACSPEVVGHRRELVEADLARVEVDGDHGRLVNGRVVLSLEQVAKGVTDGRRLEQAGRELVQQRLEGVVVVPVNVQHRGRRSRCRSGTSRLAPAVFVGDARYGSMRSFPRIDLSFSYSFCLGTSFDGV